MEHMRDPPQAKARCILPMVQHPICQNEMKGDAGHWLPVALVLSAAKARKTNPEPSLAIKIGGPGVRSCDVPVSMRYRGRTIPSYQIGLVAPTGATVP